MVPRSWGGGTGAIGQRRRNIEGGRSEGREPQGPMVTVVRGPTSPKLMRLACFRISVSPSRSFILRYLGMGARGS